MLVFNVFAFQKTVVSALMLLLALGAGKAAWGQSISSECTSAVLDQFQDKIQGCVTCFRENGESLDAAQQCCSKDSECVDLVGGLRDIVNTADACTQEDSEAFGLSFLATIGLDQQLGDVCASSDDDPSDDDSTASDACAPVLPNGGKRKMCMVHNDPHVLKFDYAPGSMITCNNVGSITLVDNEHFNVTAVAEDLEQTDSEATVAGASVLTSVTFSYKNSTCGTSTTLEDTGNFDAEGFKTSVYVAARQTGSGQRFLSVRITTPFAERSSGICVDGCPSNEVSITSTDPSRKMLQTSNSSSYDQAVEECKNSGNLPEGDFLNACAHDRAYSSDEVFVTATADDKKSYEAAQADLDSENGAGSADGSGASNAQSLHVSLLAVALAVSAISIDWMVGSLQGLFA